MILDIRVIDKMSNLLFHLCYLLRKNYSQIFAFLDEIQTSDDLIRIMIAIAESDR